MKRYPLSNHRACLAGTCLAVSAFLVLFGHPATVAADDAKKDSSGFMEKMKEWQDAMSKKFHDTFKKLKEESKEKPLTTASADLREENDYYVVRLNLPERSLEKVEVKLNGSTLHIVAPAEDQAGRYEQTLTLTGVGPDASLVIDRRQTENLIIITVPKSSSSGKAGPRSAPPGRSPMPLTDWAREIFGQMEEMQRQMDRMFENSFGQFPQFPQLHGFFDEPRFDSLFDLQAEGDDYVIHAYLPERDMDNVNVSIEGQTLKIEAKAESPENKKQNTPFRTRKTSYSQVIMLPGPVQVEKMKVDKKEGMLVVTLPKAKS